MRRAKNEIVHTSSTACHGSIPGILCVVAQEMITEYHVQRSPEECCRHLLLEVVLTACNDWLMCRERDWYPSIIKGKWPSTNDVTEMRMFFSEGWVDRLLHMAGSRLCGRRILSALERKPRMEFSRKKQADRSSETNMLHGCDNVCITTGESDHAEYESMSINRACTAWLERREDGFKTRNFKGWNDLDFRQQQSKNKTRQDRQQLRQDESTTN